MKKSSLSRSREFAEKERRDRVSKRNRSIEEACTQRSRSDGCYGIFSAFEQANPELQRLFSCRETASHRQARIPPLSSIWVKSSRVLEEISNQVFPDWEGTPRKNYSIRVAKTVCLQENRD